MTQPAKDTGLRLLQAGTVVDAAGVHASPGVLLVEGSTVVAAGSPAQIGSVPEARIESYAGSVLLPAMVNPHTHLDLSALPPRPFDGDFDTWLLAIGDMRRAQGAEDRRHDVQRGIELSLAGGTAWVGDIAGHGHPEAIEVLRTSPLEGTVFVEYFGLGANQSATAESMQTLARDVPWDEGWRATWAVSPRSVFMWGRGV